MIFARQTAVCNICEMYSISFFRLVFMVLYRFLRSDIHRRGMRLSSVSGISLHYLADITNCFRPSHIAVFHNRVIIILCLGQFQHILLDITPLAMVLAVFLCQSHCIAYMMLPSIVCRQGETYAVSVSWDVPEFRHQHLHIPHCSSYVVLRRIDVLH